MGTPPFSQFYSSKNYIPRPGDKKLSAPRHQVQKQKNHHRNHRQRSINEQPARPGRLPLLPIRFIRAGGYAYLIQMLKIVGKLARRMMAVLRLPLQRQRFPPGVILVVFQAVLGCLKNK